MKRKSYKELEMQVKELEAQLIHNHHFASVQLKNASIDRLLGSGAVLSLNYIGGKEIISPVCIKDGLSNELIEAIKADLKRSFELYTMFKP